MAIKLSSARANVQRENDGDWVDIPEWPGVEFRVRGYAYGPFQNANGLVVTGAGIRFLLMKFMRPMVVFMLDTCS
jgi:hypothetical protein